MLFMRCDTMRCNSFTLNCFEHIAQSNWGMMMIKKTCEIVRISNVEQKATFIARIHQILKIPSKFKRLKFLLRFVCQQTKSLLLLRCQTNCVISWLRDSTLYCLLIAIFKWFAKKKNPPTLYSDVTVNSTTKNMHSSYFTSVNTKRK